MGVTGGVPGYKHDIRLDWWTQQTYSNMLVKMVLKLCVLFSLWLAQVVQGAPLGQGNDNLGAALQSSVALFDVEHLPEGAQRNFDLFYPQLPETTFKEETSTSVPVIHLPAKDEEDHEKVVADAILDMFPEDLLENNKKVRPVDVKIIEHEGYIDYEIEFVELADYYDYYDDENDFGQKIEDLTTTTQGSTTVNTPEITFIDLLKKARSQHRQRQKTQNQKISKETNDDDLRVDLRPDDRWEEQKIKSQTRNSDKNARKRHQNRQQRIQESVKAVSQAEPSSAAQSLERGRVTVEHKSRNSGITGRSTTTPLPDSSTAPNVVITATATGANDATTDAPYSSIFDSITNENSYQTTILPNEEELVTTTEVLQKISDFPEQPRSGDQVVSSLSAASPPSLAENSNKNIQETSSKNEPSEEEDTFEGFSEDFATSESKSQLSVFSPLSDTDERTDNDETDHSNDFVSEDLPDNDNQPLYTHSERVPKAISSKSIATQLIPEPEEKDSEIPSDEEVATKGLYHEISPGQYHEVNPGQYHEVNPGQYHEVNPGQDLEVNPGQYHEVNPGQYRVEDKDIQFSVDDNRDDYSRTYDVRANAGDFIIGEVGRIDINSGQTLEGVRYTALESEVGYEKIKEILEMYFGTRTAAE